MTSTQLHKLAIVIINYKTAGLVIACLESLVTEIREIDAKVIVVDNRSDDGSCERIQNWILESGSKDWVCLQSMAQNLGFSGGNNVGIQTLGAEYYLLLNSDTIVRRGAISTLLAAAANDKSAGLVSPRLEWEDGQAQESCFKFHSPVSEFIFSANTGCITKIFSKWYVPQQVSNQQAYYDWTSFACVLIRQEVFKDIGEMDDGYFMYFEDVAFCYFAKKAGWKVLNIPEAHIVHLRGGSSPVKSKAKLRKRIPRYYYESRTRFFYQAYGYTGLLLANVLWLFGHGISICRSMISATFNSGNSELQWRDNWTNFRTPLKPYIHPDSYDQT